MKNIVVFGSSGAIGSEFVRQLAKKYTDAKIYAFARSKQNFEAQNIIAKAIDYEDETAIEQAANDISEIDMVIIAIGMLHNSEIMPEKSLKELSADKFQQLFKINTIIPALITKYFAPILNRNNKSIFAMLSARVGSISDNQIGGWYSYRASKAALNMIIKGAAIEIARRNKQAIIVGLHPGTVDSELSQPFQSHVKEGKLFTPEYSVQEMLKMLSNLSMKDSGKCFAYDGKEVQP